MKNPAFETPLHDMEPPYEKMDGAKIRVVTAGNTAIGDIVLSHAVAKGKFGMRIDVARPIVYLPRTAPAPLGQWETIGSITMDVLNLSKEQIQSIKKVDAADAAFEISL